MNPLRRALVFCLASGLFPSARGERVVRTVRLASGDWPPYLSETLPHYGVASRIVTKAFALQGITVQYGFFPWRRSLLLTQSGEWDGTAVWLKNEERVRDFHLSDPVMHAEYVFFHRKDVPFDWQRMRDLENYRIGISNDYFYGEAFARAMESGRLNVESVPADEQNFRKLLRRRIDIFPMDRIAGIALLRERFSPQEAALLAIHPKALYRDAMYLLLSRKDPRNRELMMEFNAGLEKLRKSGQLEGYLQEARRR